MAEGETEPVLQEGERLQESAKSMVGKNIELLHKMQREAVDKVWEQLHESVRQQRVGIMGAVGEYARGKDDRFKRFSEEQGQIPVWKLFRHFGGFVSGLGSLDPLMQLFFLQCEQLCEYIRQLNIPTDLPNVIMKNFHIREAVVGKERAIHFEIMYTEMPTTFRPPDNLIEVTFSAAEEGSAKQTMPVQVGRDGSLSAHVVPTSEGKHVLQISLCGCYIHSIDVWVQPQVNYERLQGPTKVHVGPGRPQFMHLCDDDKFLVTVTGHMRKNKCSVRKFDGTGGRVVDSEGVPDETVLEIMNPGGIALVRDKIFITDTKAGVLSCFKVSDGEIMDYCWIPSLQKVDPDVQLCEPHGICADKEGTVYVADTKNSCVKVYKPDPESQNEYKLCKTIPDESTKTVSLRNPTDVALDDDGNLYVACNGSASVEVFDPFGRHYYEKPIQHLNDVYGITVNCLGYVFVSLRRQRGKVKIFGPEGKLAGEYFGGLLPIGIATDCSGSVYVAQQTGVYKYTN